MFEGVIGGKIVLVSKLDPAGCPINIGGEQVDRVLVNLVMHARDRMPDGGILTLATSIALLGDRLEDQHVAPGKYVVLSVTSSGAGSDDEMTLSLGEEASGTGSGPGLALALATVQWIVAQHGGYVSTTSRAGEETTVNVYLPSA